MAKGFAAATAGKGVFTAVLISGFAAAATFAAGLVSTGFGAVAFATTLIAALIGATVFGAAFTAAFEVDALTAAGLTGVFEVLLGITLLLFFEDLSVTRDGFGIAILADEVLAAGLLLIVLAALALPPDDFAAIDFADAALIWAA